MVSNSLNMNLEDVLEALKRLKRQHGNSEEYKKWRRELPKDWPI